jgi:tRNA modification GTPase
MNPHENARSETVEDTIVAPATPPGEGGVAILRVSGPAAFKVAEKIFSPAGANHPVDRPRHLVLGKMVNPIDVSDIIDECLTVAMPGPHSFTGENTVEFHCHGSTAVIDAALSACLHSGARLAHPGEFTRRAFLNGRMDLAQAEALADLISSKSRLSRRAALQQLSGGLSARIHSIHQAIINVAAELEAHLDFPEEDIPPVAQNRMAAGLDASIQQIDILLSGFQKGRLVRSGARVILAGPPNSGKSSLFNALTGRERAIVSPHPGTTRDTIESTLEIGGLAVTIVDTAGIRESIDEVEKIGIQRTHEEIEAADLILSLCPSSEAAASKFEFVQPGQIPILHLYTKADLASTGQIAEIRRQFPPFLIISSQCPEDIKAVEAGILSSLGGDASSEELVLTRERHAENLSASRAALRQAAAVLETGESSELAMVDIREALINLGEIIGERLDEQILDKIFSTFCLGK